METAPTMDASKPSSLRVAGFALCVVGALLIGYGATATWVTVGIEAGGNTDTVILGTDMVDGIVAVICAVALLVGIIGSRMAGSRAARKVMSSVALASGFVAFVIGGAFLLVGTSRSAVIDAVGVPESDFELIGVVRELGPGPYLVMLGGILGFVGGIFSLAWASSQPRPFDG
jgi:hypothetical protein